MSSNSVELVFIPAPGVGHLISTVQLAKLLLQTNQAISISIHIITLPIHSSKLDSYIESESRDNLYSTRLVFVSLPTLTNPPEPTSPAFFTDIIELHKPLVKEVIDDRVRAGSPKPAGFVVDMFCTTFVDIANELGVGCYLYSTSGASFLSFVFWGLAWAERHGLEAREFGAMISDPGNMFTIPGFKTPVSGKHVPPVFTDEWGSGMILNFGRQFRKMKGILVNSYVELESFAIQSLQNSEDKTIPPVYPVGPIMDLNKGGGSQDKSKESILNWLDGQPESSVVFLCFGSMGSFGEEQVKEIANGLDRSGHRFLWTLRCPPSPGMLPGTSSDNEAFLEALPDEFLDHTAQKGKIIGWAPQVEVLAHPAIGGFVSHCGWNSTLESMWFNVPMGAWPMYAEQQLNAFELVKELEVAVEIRMDYSTDWKLGKSNVLVKDVEIEEGVNTLMNIDEKIKENVKEMSEKGRKAMENGGSSYYWLSCFIQELLSNVA